MTQFRNNKLNNSVYVNNISITFTYQVDLLSLDTEGSESAILRCFPWEEFSVSVLLVEHHGEQNGTDRNFHEFLIDKNFREFDHFTDNLGVTDYIFVNEEYFQRNKHDIDRRSISFT